MFSNLEMLGVALLLSLSCIPRGTLAQCLTGNDSPATINPNARKMLQEGRFGFALDTLRRASQAEAQENLFFSPHSLHQALTLAYFGARGTTEASLKHALHVPEEVVKVDVQRFYALENSIRQLRETQTNSTASSYEYNSANKLWVTKTKKVRECMLGLFGNELEQVDFKTDPEKVRTQVNTWASDTTKGHIHDLIPVGGITEDSDLVLANAVYFKGLWKSRFITANSKRDIFYASGSRSSFVTFMRQKGDFNHMVSEELGAHVLELPYKGEEVSMYVFLPPFAAARKAPVEGDEAQNVEQDGVRQLIERIAGTEKGAEELRELLREGMLPREVEVSLPKFTVEKQLPVGQLLNALGAGELLTPAADLTGLVAEGEGSLHLGDAVHQARVEVTEEGTTAAAATLLFSFRSSRPAEPAVFNANHPFLYLIYDKPTSSILFVGIYRTPPGAQTDQTPVPTA